MAVAVEVASPIAMPRRAKPPTVALSAKEDEPEVKVEGQRRSSRNKGAQEAPRPESDDDTVPLKGDSDSDKRSTDGGAGTKGDGGDGAHAAAGVDAVPVED